MTDYPFHLIRPEEEGPLADPALLTRRPFSELRKTHSQESRLYQPSRELATAINTAIAVGEPLLITGEPGTGKTQAAYYTAYRLGLEPVLHFQVKSDSTARDLLYHFDTVRYFHDAHLQNLAQQSTNGAPVLDKHRYVEPRVLWEAFRSAQESNTPRVVLIDEIDKAPRDFPNDLLHELDQMEFKVIETDETVSAPQQLAPIVFITSNSERRLPEPFLRRCVYHHIRFDDDLARRAIEARREQLFENLSDEFIALALDRFLKLRMRPLRKQPATGELLVWMQVLALAIDADRPSQVRQVLEEADLSKLPYIGALLKDHQDIEDLQSGIQ